MLWLASFFLFFLQSTLSFAAVPHSWKSAYRDPNVSYEAYIADPRLAGFLAQEKQTALEKAQPIDQAVLPEATRWESKEVLLERFQWIRDYRFLSDKSGLLRRSSWLFPDDGCFARAQLANRNLRNAGVPVPSKVFAFGNLKVNTRNAPQGYVSWWYHVAPIVEVEGEKYVLDPAIEPTRPLPLNEWLSRQNQSSKTLQISICSSGTYTPYHACENKEIAEKDAERDQNGYLDLEWERLEKLGRNPREELGEHPPWLQNPQFLFASE